MIANSLVRRMALAALVALAAADGSARTIHRSFRTREVGVGGGFGVAVPVDRRIDKAIDEARVPEKDHAKLFSGAKVKPARTNAVRVVRRVKVVRPKSPRRQAD